MMVVAAQSERDPYVRTRHGRYFERGILYHTVSRTRGNLFLLRPDLNGLLREIFAGIFAKAKANWPGVENYGSSALSNHLHNYLAAVRGDPRHIADYLAFIKKELTRRWKQEVGWTGSIWEGYEASAVITPDAQLRTLGYIVAQGTKENLVEDPRQWPGFHCADSLVSGDPIDGFWFNATAYGKTKYAEAVKKNGREVSREEFIESCTFSFDKLPALAHLDDDSYRDEMLELVAQAKTERKRNYSEPALGVEAICATDPMTSRPVPPPPWFEERRRMIVWDDKREPAVRAYLDRYWDHQVDFRRASAAWRAHQHQPEPTFPQYCFMPGVRSNPSRTWSRAPPKVAGVSPLSS